MAMTDERWKAREEQRRKTPAFGDLELAISLMAIRFANSTADNADPYYDVEKRRRAGRVANRQLKALGRLVSALARRSP